MAFTGGTGDILPQTLTLSTGVAGAVEDYVVNQISLPVPRFGATTDRATVFELLWVDWYNQVENIGDGSVTNFGYLSTTALRSSGDTATAAAFAADLIDPRVFAACLERRAIATEGGVVTQYPIRINLTDSNGNGILVATDTITITAAATGNTDGVVGTTIAKVAYRLVNVGTMEYVGIVQSQIS